MRSSAVTFVRCCVNRCAVGILIALCIGAAGSGWASNLQTRSFELEHVSVREAITVVLPLISADGSFTVGPGLTKLTVRDHTDHVESITRRIEEIDQPPLRFHLTIELIKASNRDEKQNGDLFIHPGVRSMFHYNWYHRIGVVGVTGALGEHLQVELGESYTIEFEARMDTQVGDADEPLVAAELPSPGSQTRERNTGEGRQSSPQQAPANQRAGGRIRLQHVTLAKVSKDAMGVTHSQQVLRSNILIGPGNEVFLYTGQSEQSERALILAVRYEYPKEH